MKNVPDGNYIVEVTCLGYQSVSDSLKIKGSTRRNFQLTEEAKELGEVTVVADRSQIVKGQLMVKCSICRLQPRK